MRNRSWGRASVLQNVTLIAEAADTLAISRRATSPLLILESRSAVRCAGLFATFAGFGLIRFAAAAAAAAVAACSFVGRRQKIRYSFPRVLVRHL